MPSLLRGPRLHAGQLDEHFPRPEEAPKGAVSKGEGPAKPISGLRPHASRRAPCALLSMRARSEALHLIALRRSLAPACGFTPPSNSRRVDCLGALERGAGKAAIDIGAQHRARVNKLENIHAKMKIGAN